MVNENKHQTKGSSDHLHLKCSVRGSCCCLLAASTHPLGCFYKVYTSVESIHRLTVLLHHFLSLQQIDEIWREMRWITEALQYARYKQPAAGLPIKKFVDLSEEHSQKKISSSSSHLDCLPSPPPSPEARLQRRKAVSGKRTLLCSSNKIL